MLWLNSKVYIPITEVELKGEAIYPLKTDRNKLWLSSLCLLTLSKQKFLSPEGLCSVETFETEQSNLFLLTFCSFVWDKMLAVYEMFFSMFSFPVMHLSLIFTLSILSLCNFCLPRSLLCKPFLLYFFHLLHMHE